MSSSVFTDGIDKWWPRDHHIGSSPLKQMVIEPKAGGRWYSISRTAPNATTEKCSRGIRRSASSSRGRSPRNGSTTPSSITEVEVTFTAEGPKKTRVDLEHRNMARFGVAADATRAMFDSPGAWEQDARRDSPRSAARSNKITRVG